jgi:hypothetical protein
MSNFYLDIDGPSHMDKYLQVKHEDTADDGPVLGVARVLDKEDSKIEAEKIAKRYNAHEALVDVLRRIAEFERQAPQLPPDLHRAAQRVLDDLNIDATFVLAQDPTRETATGEPTT